MRKALSISNEMFSFGTIPYHPQIVSSHTMGSDEYLQPTQFLLPDDHNLAESQAAGPSWWGHGSKLQFAGHELCLQTRGCIKQGAESKSCICVCGGWESPVWDCANAIAGKGALSLRVSRKQGRDGGESRSMMQINPVTLETHAVGTFSKLWSLSFVFYLFLLMCYYSCYPLSKKMLHVKGRFSQFSSSRKEENDVSKRKSLLKFWQVLLEEAVLILLQCFLPDAQMEGFELFQFFYSLCQSGS